MNSFGKLLKKLRNEAGLSQQQLADKMDVSKNTIQNWESGKTKVDTARFRSLAFIFNVPVENLIGEMCREEGGRADRWPYFLFDDETNAIVSSLHLNLNQQDLFGLLYLYKASYLKKEVINFNTLNKDLKLVPYKFISKVGSIQFMNMVDSLQKVIKHVRSDFLIMVLKLNPEEEFDIRRLSKELICEFIDGGYKKLDEDAIYTDREGNSPPETLEELEMLISMKKARIILPLLENGPMHLADGCEHYRLRGDVPEEVITMNDCYWSWWTGEYSEDNHFVMHILDDLNEITDYHPVSVEGEPDKWVLEINEKGRSLLNWFREKE